MCALNAAVYFASDEVCILPSTLFSPIGTPMSRETLLEISVPLWIMCCMCGGTVTWSRSNWPRFNTSSALHWWTVVFLVSIGGISIRYWSVAWTWCSPPGSFRVRVGEATGCLVMVCIGTERLARCRCMIIRLRALHQQDMEAVLEFSTWAFVVGSAAAECFIVASFNGWLVVDSWVAVVSPVLAVVFGIPCAVLTGRGFFRAAREAHEEESKDDWVCYIGPSTAKWLRGTAWRLIGSIVTTQLQILWCQLYIYPELGMRWLEWTSMDPATFGRMCNHTYPALMLVDYCFNCTASLSLGDVGRVQLDSACTLIATHREREIQEMLQARRQASASAVAALLGDKDPTDIMELSKERFRAVSWDRLTYEIFATGGVSNNQGHGASTELLELSQPVFLGGCDAFVSHSWHDSAPAKWKALSEWCEEFRCREGRAPLLWVDKVCIDQNSIEADLKCLPVFLAACQTLLVLAGPTYPWRLWCVLELYVFMEMHGLRRVPSRPTRGRELFKANSERSSMVPEYSMTSGLSEPSLPSLGRTQPMVVRHLTEQTDGEQLMQIWEDFDAARCLCFRAEDKSRILDVIDGTFLGGVSGFNSAVRNLLTAPGGGVLVERQRRLQGVAGDQSWLSGASQSQVKSCSDSTAHFSLDEGPDAPRHPDVQMHSGLPRHFQL